MRDINNLPAWEGLFKKIVWRQLGDIKDKDILEAVRVLLQIILQKLIVWLL